MPAFTAEEYEIVNYVEQEYTLSGRVPSASVIAEKLGHPEVRVAKFTSSDKFREAVKARGIRLSGVSGSTDRGVLTEIQLACANTLLDFADTRSDRKKLQDLGISSQTYQGWLKDPAYQAYITQRAENLLPDITSEAHLALIGNVRRGDLGSIKLYYEMTGRWSSKTVGELNVEFLLMKILEAVQKHVKDPEAITAIAEELSVFAAAPSPPVAGTRVVEALPSGSFEL